MRATTQDGAFQRRPAAPWARPGGLEAVLEHWRGDPRVARQLALDVAQPGTSARYRPIPASLAEPVRGALTARGVRRLYTHQVEAFERARRGEDVVVATPTASGKSLCYNLPVLDTFARRPEARALYLFPTKALSRDQEEGLRGLMEAAGLSHGAITYDGDTPGDVRRAARDRSGVLVTNPDMLHSGILPHHAGWARFFGNLTHVVVDELHIYRGVFGSHLANVLRRLERVASFHGSRPRFLFSSATIANPEEHAGRLSGRTVHLVGDSGAPSAPRQVMVYNPALVNPELGLRRSYVKCAVDRTADLLRAGVSTLVFGQSRSAVEVMLKYLRDLVPESELPPDQVRAYRGGYLPGTRREIERGLREGAIRCVVATNALELGIDIGDLDAVVCAGYPGTMAGLMQRFGRGGRRGRSSLALLVPSSAPLDQFLAHRPELLLDAPIEAARIDPENVEILVQHLKCAAFELQFRLGEGEQPGQDGFPGLPGEALVDALGFLEDHRVVRSVPSRGGGTTFHWADRNHPASDVSLRSPSYDNFVIIDVERDRILAEMDFWSTHTQLHEQAIYQHDAAQYQVERLDYDNHKAFVRKVASDYYTTAMTRVRVSVLEEHEEERRPLAPPFSLGLGHGEVDVVEKVVGYKKIRFHTHENVGFGEVGLPAVEKPTTAFWVTVPEAVIAAAEAPRAVVMDALRGWLAALCGVASVGLMMDPRDLGTAFVDEPALHGRTATRSGAPALEGGGERRAAALPGGAEPGRLEPGRLGSGASGSPTGALGSRGPAGSEDGPAVVDGSRGSAGSEDGPAVVDGRALAPAASGVLAPATTDALPPAASDPHGPRAGWRGAEGFEPTLYLYDAVAGGVGLSARLWEEREALLLRSAQLVAACACEDGCPSCVGPTVGRDPGRSRRRVLLRMLDRVGLLRGTLG